MIAQRILHPCSKLAATRLWKTTTLAEELNVADADVDEVYDALDWLLDRQKRIENKLAKRHLANGDHVRYDVSSSSYTGRTCVLACFGKNRDGIPDLALYRLRCDDRRRRAARGVDVYPGNTGDPSTVPDQVDKLEESIRLEAGGGGRRSRDAYPNPDRCAAQAALDSAGCRRCAATRSAS